MATPTLVSATVMADGITLRMVWSELISVNPIPEQPILLTGERDVIGTSTGVESDFGNPADTDTESLTSLPGKIYAGQIVKLNLPFKLVTSHATSDNNAARMRYAVVNSSTQTKTFSTEIAAVIADCVTAFGQPITLKRVVAGALSANSNRVKRDETYVSYSVNAIRGRLSQSRLGDAMATQGQYSIMLSDLTNDIPAIGWRIVDNGNEREVVRVEVAADRTAARLFVEELA